MKGCRVLTDEERQAILETACLRDQVLFMTGLYFGTRISEALQFTFGTVKGSFVYLKSSKKSDNQSYPIPEEYKTLVAQLQAEYESKGMTVTDNTPLFLSQKGRYTKKAMSRQQAANIIKALRKELGIDGNVGFHSFRKAFVTKIYEMTGHDIVKTQVYSRHKNLSNLQYYIHTTEDTSLVTQLAW